MDAAMHTFPLAICEYLRTYTHDHAMLPYLILFKSCGKRCTQATDAHMYASNANTKNGTTFSYESINFQKYKMCAENGKNSFTQYL